MFQDAQTFFLEVVLNGGFIATKPSYFDLRDRWKSFSKVFNLKFLHNPSTMKLDLFSCLQKVKSHNFVNYLSKLWFLLNQV